MTTPTHGDAAQELEALVNDLERAVYDHTMSEAHYQATKYQKDAIDEARAALTAAIAALVADAERYRYLLGHAEMIRGNVIDWECAYGEGTDWGVEDRSLDAAIDAARTP